MAHHATKSALTLAFTVALSAGAMADPVPPCQAMKDFATQGGLIVASVASTESGGCVFRDVLLSQGSMQSWHVEEVETGPLDPAALEAAKITSLRLAARQVTFRLRSQSAISNFIQNSMARPFDIGLDFDYDAPNGVFHLSRFIMTGPAIGTLRVAATLEGVSVMDMASPDLATSRAGIGSIDVELDNHGMLESFALPLLAGSLDLYGEKDPAAKFGQMKAGALGEVAGLLAEAGAPEASIKAIGAFITALPHPNGDFHLQANFPAPLTVADIGALAEASDGRAAIIKKLAAITATYTPAPPPPRMALEPAH